MRPTKQQSGKRCTTWTRRSLLSMAPIALSGLVDAEPQQGRGGGRGPQAAPKPPYPIIDTHIHLFDSSRPQGVPYGAGRPPALPEVYRFIAEPLGVVGAIEIEASPWVEDNLWVLDVSQKDPIMV